MWQLAVELILELSQSTFAYRFVEFSAYWLVELSTGKPAGNSMTRWLSSVLRLAGLRADQAQFLSMGVEAAWMLGRGPQMIRN